MPKYVELRELPVGARFMFYADDLDHRGPCTLVEKGQGAAIIRYEPHTITRTFKARDRHGQMVERTITRTLSGESHCALGAQVVPMHDDVSTVADVAAGYIPVDVDPTPLAADVDPGDPDDGRHL